MTPRDRVRNAAAVVGIGIVLIVGVLLFGPVVEGSWDHCTETPPPDSGIKCQSYFPPIDD